jgi:alcohol dehydrogenase, propanol-preferring
MQTDIPRTQHAAVVTGHDQPIEFRTDWPVVMPSELKPGYCLIRMLVSGVCHSDLHVRDGEWPSVPPPFIGGHEGVGIVVAIGEGTPESDEVKVGSRVGIKWTADACGRCEFCRAGDEPGSWRIRSPKRHLFLYGVLIRLSVCSQVKASGMTINGTFSEYVVSFLNGLTAILRL